MMFTLEYTNTTRRNIFNKNFYGFVHDCKKCSYATKSLFFMRNHIKRHRIKTEVFDCSSSTPEIYLCKKCNFRTYETTTFNLHIKNHVLKKTAIVQNLPNQASDEHKLAKDENKYWYNTRTRHKEANKMKSLESVKCFQDGRKYVKARVKKFIALEKEKFLCDCCDYKCSGKKNLKKHIISKHTPLENIEWFYCSMCSYKGKLSDRLKVHIYNKHTASTHTQWFHCDKCSYVTKNRIYARKHVSAKHTKFLNIKWARCDRCRYKTKNRQLLSLHIDQIHTATEDTKILSV